ncbi:MULTISPECIES: hypothetical protein [Streptomyces]|uniref:hypothetical protein n=1 Tax=Streptomyces TaxID=1883 RepID=UPI002E7BDB2B|nr:hypothetical protein [Streptomyces huasconensis]
MLHECDLATAERFHTVIFEGVVEPSARLIQKVPRHGIERGEARSEGADAYVCDAIPAVLMCRSKVCGSEWRDEEFEGLVNQVVDQVTLPLPHP